MSQLTIEDFLYKIENEGLPYTVIDYSTWEDLKEDYPELYTKIIIFRAAYNNLDKYIDTKILEI